MKWVKNYERVQDIQRQLTWPTVTDLDPRVFIPEVSLYKQQIRSSFLKYLLSV